MLGKPLENKHYSSALVCVTEAIPYIAPLVSNLRKNYEVSFFLKTKEYSRSPTLKHFRNMVHCLMQPVEFVNVFKHKPNLYPNIVYLLLLFAKLDLSRNWYGVTH
jgi:hypothetical protein